MQQTGSVVAYGTTRDTQAVSSAITMRRRSSASFRRFPQLRIQDKTNMIVSNIIYNVPKNINISSSNSSNNGKAHQNAEIARVQEHSEISAEELLELRRA